MNEKMIHIYTCTCISISNAVKEQSFYDNTLRENYLFIQGYRNKYARAICVNQIKKMGNFTDKF